MKILFDHQTFSIQEFGGISRYYAELISGISNTIDNQAHLSLVLSNNIHLKEIGINKISFFPGQNFPTKGSIIYSLNRQFCRRDIKKAEYDIFHATYYDPYFLPFIKKKKFVITLHDMIHEKFSDQYKEFGNNNFFTDHKRILSEKAAAIIAVSESTKNDIINIFNINPEKIKVVYHGSSMLYDDSVKDKSPITYLLYVGNRQRYKNFQGLLRAIASLLKRYEIKLICAGGGEFDAFEHNFIRKMKIDHYIEYRSIKSDEALQRLYKSALAFIFPSKYEGFGIPILEAFANACPCLLSNSSSLPEVAGEAALYFDPDNDDSIRRTVEQAVNDSKLRNDLIKKGRDRLELFSWRQTVDKTINVYKSCVNS